MDKYGWFGALCGWAVDTVENLWVRAQAFAHWFAHAVHSLVVNNDWVLSSGPPLKFFC